MKQPIPFGKYYLLERINVGGMAEVFRAKAYGVEGFERLVAVKRILPNIAEDKEFIGMFIDEAKISVQLNHANIAQIFDLGMVDSAYYIALEHVHGRDLRAIFERCRDRGQPMPVAQAAFIAMKVCEGLDYAHNKRDQSGRELHLVHRDVSPQNILVSFEGEVKIIDFGIAKAAGKGSQTQAGILKGKFGYMSPEQVRGLPIDRRSDIFSCGIVLYELLTGERLFVGASDFSTLEKVRNVEILPPSTRNRKIPAELESIVLKALAKEEEDRYQNAIDLHDHLQAFVYQAGAFCSRKDLAAWMKETFTREIEEETAKLESYRELRPPEMKAASVRRASPPSPPRRATMAMPMVVKPPPPPVPAAPAVAAPAAGGKRSATLASQGVDAASAPPAAALADAGPSADELNWDDEELETQIYDGADEVKPQARVARAHADQTLPLGSMATSAAPAPMSASAPPRSGPRSRGKDHTARGWDTVQPSLVAPGQLAAGSNPSSSPFAEEPGEIDPFGLEEDSALRAALATAAPGDATALARGSRILLYVGMAAAALLIGAGAAGFFLLRGGDGPTADQRASAHDVADGAPPAVGTGAALAEASPEVARADTAGLSREALAETGFDLLVEPGDATVKLNGETLDMSPPMKVRSIPPGDHELVIHGPAGYYSKSQTIRVEAGKAERITIELDPSEIAATFTSEPPGADVTLIINKSRELRLGQAPVEHRLDPQDRYEVRFDKRGYVTRVEPVSLRGREERVEVVLERMPRSRSQSETVAARASDTRATSSERKAEARKSDTTRTEPSGARAVETGTLRLNSKPFCQIFVNGEDTGKKTPQRDLMLPAGRHRITLVNSEHGISETFTVTIKAGQEVTHIKDYSDQIQ